MTSATERLRALLDERGVEWWPMHDDEVGYREDRDTEFLVYGCKHVAHEWGCRLQVDMLTPEQAVAATLGPGTCKPVISDNLTESEGTGDAWADCSACGHLLFVLTDPNSQPPNYCPNCGAKVVDA